ncbi:MAG: hypothetical protein EBU07_16510, partial [Betaproteobacteria bacterium]|nr:hypothetical protein [Betaproteobacteria bacterium]
VEAVFLATPAPDHVRHTLLCLAAGKHVLSAVPAAMTLDECAQLVGAVKQAGLTYMMGETSCWQQLTITARKFYQEGAFGRLFHVESEYHHPGLESLYFENGQRSEPEDHIAILCEIMANFASGAFDADLETQRAFFEAHVKPWGARFFAMQAPVQRRPSAPTGRAHDHASLPWHCLYFFPLPQGQGSLRPTLGTSPASVAGSVSWETLPSSFGCV